MNGAVIGIAGATVMVDLPDLKLYDRVYVGHARLTGEVVRLERDYAVVQVFEETRGLGIGEPVEGSDAPLTVKLGPGLLGGIFDGLQRPLPELLKAQGPFVSSGCEPFPMDQARSWIFEPASQVGEEVRQGDLLGSVLEGHLRHPLFASASGRLASLAVDEVKLSEPLAVLDDGREMHTWQSWPARHSRPHRGKQTPEKPLVTGQRCLDFLFPLCKGGVAIIPGGFGTGKTVLEQTIAKFADSDVVVYVGCGERGNEMAGLLQEFCQLQDPRTERPLLERTIVIANTSNMPVAARESSIFTGVTLAEYYRDMGLDVLLLADSLSRWAEALREISASLEEMPGEEGFPTYLGSRLSGFIERAGVVETMAGRTGSLSMILAVSPPGADFSEPVTQTCLRVAGAFFMLDTGLAQRRHFPAINWTQSYSLYGRQKIQFLDGDQKDQWQVQRKRCQEILQQEEALREVVEVVGMQGLQDKDRLLMLVAERVQNEFLCQNSFTEDAFSSPEQTLARIDGLVRDYDRFSAELAEGAELDELLKGVRDEAG